MGEGVSDARRERSRAKTRGRARVRFGDPRRGGDDAGDRPRTRARTSATVHQHVAVIHPRTPAPQAHSAVHEPRAVPPSVPRGVPLRETVVARVRLGLVGAKAPRRRRVRLERRKPHRARRAYSPRPRDGRYAPPDPAQFRRAHRESGKRRASRQQAAINVYSIPRDDGAFRARQCTRRLGCAVATSRRGDDRLVASRSLRVSCLSIACYTF